MEPAGITQRGVAPKPSAGLPRGHFGHSPGATTPLPQLGRSPNLAAFGVRVWGGVGCHKGGCALVTKEAKKKEKKESVCVCVFVCVCAYVCTRVCVCVCVCVCVLYLGWKY